MSDMFPVERAGVALLPCVEDAELLVMALDACDHGDSEAARQVAEAPRLERLRNAIQASIAEARELHARRRAHDAALSEGHAISYQADAILGLGDGRSVHMRNATADHLERHVVVLDEVAALDPSQRSACAAKKAWISEILPVLRERDCTLGALEGA